MSRVKINYTIKHSTLYEYELRIPIDLNYFMISRYSKENHEFILLIYDNNKISLYGYQHNENRIISYNENQNYEIQKQFMFDLLNSIGINWLSLEILDSLNFRTNHLKIKHWKEYYFNRNIQYILKEIKYIDDEYKKKYDIFIENKENAIGEIYANDNDTKLAVTIYPNNRIDITRLCKSKIYKNYTEKTLKFPKNRH